MTEIRVPMKGHHWQNEKGMFCGLEDGRIYQAIVLDIKPAGAPPYGWFLIAPAIPDR